jgi:hypothetical protein
MHSNSYVCSYRLPQAATEVWTTGQAPYRGSTVP